MLRGPTRFPVPNALASALVLALAGTPLPALAHHILVTSGGDPDPATPTTCSLRQALLSARNPSLAVGGCVLGESGSASVHVVEAAPWMAGQTITLERGELEVFKPLADPTVLTVRGHGMVIDADGASRVMRVHDATEFPNGSRSRFTLEDVTLTGGVALGTGPVDGQGGGLFMFAQTVLTLNRVEVTGNRARSGGGISVYGHRAGTTTEFNPHFRLVDSVVSGNEAVGGESEFDPPGSGGGVYVRDVCAEVVRTTISGNHAGYGAGISAYRFDEDFFCTVLGFDERRLALYRSTVSGNTAPVPDGWYQGSAAIYSAFMPVTLNGTTITANHGGNTPAILMLGSLTIVNSIVSANTRHDPGVDYPSPDIGFSKGGGTSARSVLGAAALGMFGGAGNPGNVFTDSPGLGPLADNGGFNATHLPSVTSPALELGREPECTTRPAIEGMVTDQRRVAQPVGANCDAGSVERRQGSFTVSGIVVGSGRLDATPTPTGAGSSGGITNCTSTGGACVATFVGENDASSLRIVATPSPGWELAGWTGDCLPTPVVGEAFLSIDANRTCTATFALPDRIYRNGFEATP